MIFYVFLMIVLVFFVAERQIYLRCWDKKLTYECRFSTDEAFEGDEIELVETVTNNKWLPIPWAKTEISTSKWLDYAGSQSVVTDQTRFVPSFFVLKSHHRVVRRWKVKCLRRGVFGVGKITIVATDLLGRESLSMPVSVRAEVTVLPKPLDSEALALTPSGLNGETVVRRRLITDPFYVSGVREYTRFDSANRIHWPATAREGRMMVRNNDCTSHQTVAVILNMQTRRDEARVRYDEGDIEQGIRAAATCLEQAAQQGILMRLLANGGMPGKEATVTRQGSGEDFFFDELRVLARLENEKSENLMPFLASLNRETLATDVYLITAYWENEMADFARRQAFAGVQVHFILTRPLDGAELPEDCTASYFLPARGGGEGVA